MQSLALRLIISATLSEPHLRLSGHLWGLCGGHGRAQAPSRSCRAFLPRERQGLQMCLTKPC